MLTTKKFATGGGLILALLGLLLSVSAWSCGTRLSASTDGLEPRQVVIPLEPPSSWDKESYYHELLRMVLAATEPEYGPCQLVAAPYVLTRSRMAQAISRGKGMDVLWANATREREAQMLAVRVPLLKGLMSYKVAMIRSDDQARFAAIDSLEKLRELRIGVGLDWPDATIMRANGLQTVGTNNYESLFKMLAAGRFDLMLRGVSEISAELLAYPELNLALKQELMVVFPSPVYFFVHPGQEGLAQRLALGLRRLRVDGSFDEHFYRHPSVISALEHIHARKYTIIYLDNPLLPEEVPLVQNDFWLFPWRQRGDGRWLVALTLPEPPEDVP